MKKAVIYCDGGCSPNPGNGGWGAYISIEGKTFEIYGGERNTTNNRMELKAAIEALRYLKEPHNVTLYTDSKYVKDGIKSWIKKWVKNNWETTDKKPVKNKELWKALLHEFDLHQISIKWVKGHSGVHGNERADELATRGARSLKILD